MTDLDVQDAAAKADNMVNPAFLAASMIEERAADIVEALNDMPSELAVAVLLHLPPDRAVEVLDQPGLEREPELVTLMPLEAAAKLLAGVSADRLAEVMRRELKLYGIDVVVVAPATVDTPIWDQSEGAIGRYAATDYGRAFDKGVRTIVRAGHRHGLQAKDVAKTVMKALTARRPRLRYAPAQHALMERALPGLAPKRVTDFVIAHGLGLMPDEKKALRGVSV